MKNKLINILVIIFIIVMLSNNYISAFASGLDYDGGYKKAPEGISPNLQIIMIIISCTILLLYIISSKGVKWKVKVLVGVVYTILIIFTIYFINVYTKPIYPNDLGSMKYAGKLVDPISGGYYLQEEGIALYILVNVFLIGKIIFDKKDILLKILKKNFPLIVISLIVIILIIIGITNKEKIIDMLWNIIFYKL